MGWWVGREDWVGLIVTVVGEGRNACPSTNTRLETICCFVYPVLRQIIGWIALSTVIRNKKGKSSKVLGEEKKQYPLRSFDQVSVEPKLFFL